MNIASLIVAIAAVIVAALSFILAQMAAIRSRKAETVQNLLGEKETVAFGALKLMRDGLPSKDSDRRLIIDAVIQACVFESSDRARALLYRLIEMNPRQHIEFTRSLRSVQETFQSMEKYSFTNEQLNLDRGKRRMETIRKVLDQDGDYTAPASS